MTVLVKIRQIAVAVIFVLILLFPSLDFFYPTIPKVESRENRTMMEFPNIDSISYVDYPGIIDSFYLDNFSTRNQLLTLNSHIKFNLFNIPPKRGEAFIGKDGWMFLVKKELDTYTGANIANKDELEHYYEVLKNRRDFLVDLGSKFFFVILPVKTSIYPEYLPLSKKRNLKFTLTDQIVKIADTMESVILIDLRDELKKAKSIQRLYHVTDNHWNEYGAFIATQEILRKIKDYYPLVDTLDESEYELKLSIKEGMPLSNMMGIHSGSYEDYITFRHKGKKKSREGVKSNYPPLRYFAYKNQFETVFITDDKTLPKILVIRESFGKFMIPYLSESFSKSVYIFDAWKHRLNRNIVLNEKPDIYIQLILECYLPNMADNAEIQPKRKK